VLQPIRKARNVEVTGMARLANIRPAEMKSAPVHRQVKVETIRKERITTEKRHAERLRVMGRERHTTERNLATKAPTSVAAGAFQDALLRMAEGLLLPPL
jgi:hypothetical protein